MASFVLMKKPDAIPAEDAAKAADGDGDEDAAEREAAERTDRAGPGGDDPGGARAPPARSASAPWDPLAAVDSALLSALCDQRERRALVRLERTLLDFMASPSDRIAVGGAYNAVVLRDGEGIDAPTVSAGAMQEIAMQQARGARQTSFQRLILHRCADRFGIAREVIPQSENVITQLNLIRLIKTEESEVPGHLLADVDLGLLVDYKNPLARGGGGGASPGQEDGTKALSDSVNSSSLNDNSAAKKTKKKMVIMKRNSSGAGADDKNKGKKKEKSRKGRELVDREKAYEEARARIFGVEAAVEGAIAEEGSNNDDDTGRERVENKGQLNPQVVEFAPSASLSLSQSQHSHSSAVSDSAEVSGENVESKSEQVDDVQLEAPREAPETETKPKQSRNKSKQSKQSAKKAVYRNRQQEEADPDFKRRSDFRPAYIQAHAHPYANNPYAPNNPYVNMVNVAMGGQHPQQHMHPMAMQQYYNQYYPNHTASPQSPAYFVGSAGYPHHQGAPGAAAGVPSNAQNANGVAPAGSGSASDPSLDRCDAQQTAARRDPPNRASPEAAPGCDTSPREGAVPAYTPEEFPALT